MAHPENQYLDQLRYVLEHGNQRIDRTGVGTIATFGGQMEFDLSKGFPALTTKKLAIRSVIYELLWFIEGSGDERRLREIMYGDENSKKATIWTGNAEAPYWKPKAKHKGDLGRIYGVQWRNWQSPTNRPWWQIWKPKVKSVDQLANLIQGIRTDPYGRRHIISAWNPGELDQMALPPCHVFAQFFVSDGTLSCKMYQRSADLALGIPFNIASYALFTHMIAQSCGLQVGKFIHTLGDTHIYSNHIEQVKEQLTRVPYPWPTLWINPDVKDINQFTIDDFQLVGYQHHPTIKMDMAV